MNIPSVKSIGKSFAVVSSISIISVSAVTASVWANKRFDLASKLAKLNRSQSLKSHSVKESPKRLQANTEVLEKKFTVKQPAANQDFNHQLSENSAQDAFSRAPVNWIPATVLIGTPIAATLITPWYLATHNVSKKVWLVAGAVGVWTGMSITAGYHRLLSHRTYKAHPIVEKFLLLGATLAVQGSAFDWCAGHRTHHRYVDDPMDDPYSAKRGFWFSHIGWMLRNYPSGDFDYKNIKDLKKDKLMQIQHKYYGLWVLATNVGLIGSIGWLVGDVWGTLLLAGLLRLVINHHLTFFINSLCHMYGKRPYTDSNTARDNFLLAIPTWGEGYHNYHHFFQYDYRNGVKWWQYDPTKWFIALLAKVGLASDLRVVDNVTIKHAEIQQQIKQFMQEQTQQLNEYGHTVKTSLGGIGNKAGENMGTLVQLLDRFKFEQDLFDDTMALWQKIKANGFSTKQSRSTTYLQEMDEDLAKQYAIVEQRMTTHYRNFAKTLNQLDKQLIKNNLVKAA